MDMKPMFRDNYMRDNLYHSLMDQVDKPLLDSDRHHRLLAMQLRGQISAFVRRYLK